MMQLCLTVLTKNQSCSEFQALKLILENMGINNSNFIANQNFFTRISVGVSTMFTDKDKVWDVLFSVWVKIFDWFLQPPALLDIIIEHMLQRQLVCLSVCLFLTWRFSVDLAVLYINDEITEGGVRGTCALRSVAVTAGLI